ncbi:MAG: hypothetical protein M0042_15195 [Nitrospiraceae bacterium]|nr:hypothetical protein [Nitrospiraceae bacterium]
MTTAIFGIRFHSNESLQPDPEALAAFLDSPRAPGARERHRDDLAAYVDYLAAIEAFEAGRLHTGGAPDFPERMLLGVLSHSAFFRNTLRIAIEEFKYHRHQLSLLDLQKPRAFIRSAEAELAKLSPKKRDDLPRIARFQDMIAQRKRDLDALLRRREMLAGELYHIAAYINENLVLISRLCEASIEKLALVQVNGEKSAALIEDVKRHFKEQVRDSVQAGGVTKDYLESLKTEVAELTKQLSRLMLEDLYAVTGIYEALHAHVEGASAALRRLLAEADTARKRNGMDSGESYGGIENVLVGLISRFRPQGGAPAPDAGPSARLVAEKQREMLDHVFELLRSVRPAGTARP